MVAQTTNAQLIAFWNATANIQKFGTVSPPPVPLMPATPPVSPPPSPCPLPEPQLIISPITPDVKKPARRDYNEQCLRIKQGLPLVWDDSRFNRARPGDLFGFWFYNSCVRVHKIISTSPPTERLPTWSDNVGQGDRNVITLSKSCTIIPWDRWIELNGAKRCMGTAHVLKGLQNILDYVNI